MSVFHCVVYKQFRFQHNMKRKVKNVKMRLKHRPHVFNHMSWWIQASPLSGAIVLLLMIFRSKKKKNHRCWRALDSIRIYGFRVPLKRCLQLVWNQNHGHWGYPRHLLFLLINNPPNHLILKHVIRVDTGQEQAEIFLYNLQSIVKNLKLKC